MKNKSTPDKFVQKLAAVFGKRVTKQSTWGHRYRGGVDTIKLDVAGLTLRELKAKVKECLKLTGCAKQAGVPFPAFFNDCAEFYVQCKNRSEGWYAVITPLGTEGNASLEISFTAM